MMNVNTQQQPYCAYLTDYTCTAGLTRRQKKEKYNMARSQQLVFCDSNNNNSWSVIGPTSPAVSRAPQRAPATLLRLRPSVRRLTPKNSQDPPSHRGHSANFVQLYIKRWEYAQIWHVKMWTVDRHPDRRCRIGFKKSMDNKNRHK